jgi:hypothetical protein
VVLYEQDHRSFKARGPGCEAQPAHHNFSMPSPDSVDTWLRHRRPRFELSRGIVAECGVTTQPIREHFDVLKDVLCRFGPCAVLTMLDQLAVQCAEEAFDTRVVPAVPPTRHAAGHTVCREQLRVCHGGILAAPIRVVQQPGFGGAMADRHRQRLLREVTGEPSLQRPADHGARVEIEDDREIEPALRGPDIGDVPGTHPVRTRDRELTIKCVRRHWHPGIRLRRGAPLLHGLGSDPFGTHQPRDAVLADTVPLLN